jgi:hypothetical protein
MGNLPDRPNGLRPLGSGPEALCPELATTFSFESEPTAILRLMELAEATRQALLILEEEQISPTVGYEFVSPHWQQHLQSLTDVVQSYSKPQTGGVNIYTMRQQRPRKVSETPKLYVFRSENYGYLRTLFEQVREGDRDAFISTLLELVPSGKSSRKSIERAKFPQVSSSVSCLPLLAEFCIRTNFTGALLKSLQTITLPQVGVAVMLLQLEETIALLRHLSRIRFESDPRRPR